MVFPLLVSYGILPLFPQLLDKGVAGGSSYSRLNPHRMPTRINRPGSARKKVG